MILKFIFPFLSAVCATLRMATILVLIIVVLFLQQNINRGSVKRSLGFDEKESRLRSDPDIKNEKSLYQNRKRRSLSNDVKKFLENYGENQEKTVFKNELKAMKSEFVSMLCMGQGIQEWTK